MQFTRLFSPLKLGNIELKNRFVVPAMGTNLGSQDGTASEALINYWAERAKGGWGLLIIEVTAVDPLGRNFPNGLGLWDDTFISPFRKLTDAVHAYGAKVAVQLHHGGRQTSSEIVGGKIVAPSPVPCPRIGEIPRELSTEEAYQIIEKFGDAAQRAREAGFDAVEVHGAHGYLIAQFMSGYFNKRNDEFGGTFLNRMRFPVGVIQDIRRKTDDGFPIIFRCSSEEKVTGGRCLDETRVLTRMVTEAGASAINLSIGVYGSFPYIIAPAAIPPGFLLTAAAEIKKTVSVPVIAVGRINNPMLAEDAIQTGKADLIGMGRQSLADPALPNKVAAKKVDEICPCIACMECTKYAGHIDRPPTTCTANPFCGREGEMKMDKATKSKKVIIVGGGPAGLEAAWIAAARGHKVVLYEKESVLGGQLRVAAIPPTKQEMSQAIVYYNKMAKKNGVHFKLGIEATADRIFAEKPDVAVLATGGGALIPDIKGVSGANVLTAVEVLEGKKTVSDKVLIVGGGLVGCETADFLGEYGHKITIIDVLPEIATDLAAGEQYFLMQRLKTHGVVIKTGIMVTEFLENGITGQKNSKEIQLTGFDTIILAMGVKPNTDLKEKLEGRVPEFYVIGDAKVPRKAMDAIREGANLAIRL